MNVVTERRLRQRVCHLKRLQRHSRALAQVVAIQQIHPALFAARHGQMTVWDHGDAARAEVVVVVLQQGLILWSEPVLDIQLAVFQPLIARTLSLNSVFAVVAWHRYRITR